MSERERYNSPQSTTEMNDFGNITAMNGALLDSFRMQDELYIEAIGCFRDVDYALIEADFPNGALGSFLDTVSYLGECEVSGPVKIMLEASTPQLDNGFDVFGSPTLPYIMLNGEYDAVKHLEVPIIAVTADYRSFIEEFAELKSECSRAMLDTLISYSLSMGELGSRDFLQRQLFSLSEQ